MADRTSNKKYKPIPEICDFISDISLKGQYPMLFHRNEDKDDSNVHRVLSLFSGCGGMDLGFEGHFIASRKSFADNDQRVEKSVSENWVMLKKTNFKDVFANDILPEAEFAWTTYMNRFGYDPSIYHCQSIVDLVKMQKAGADIFPKNIDIVLGGFPCQDFSVAGKRMGFNSQKDDYGKIREEDKPTEESD